MNTEPLPIYYL